jgi:hypothetical protein
MMGESKEQVDGSMAFRFLISIALIYHLSIFNLDQFSSLYLLNKNILVVYFLKLYQLNDWAKKIPCPIKCMDLMWLNHSFRI